MFTPVITRTVSNHKRIPQVTHYKLSPLHYFMHIPGFYTTTVFQFWFIRYGGVTYTRHIDRRMNRQTGLFLYTSQKALFAGGIITVYFSKPFKRNQYR